MHRRPFARSKPALVSVAVVAALMTFAVAVAPGIGSASIGLPTSTTARTADDTGEVKLDVPSGIRTGDVLVASIAYRAKKQGQRVTVSAPTEWTLAAQVDRGGTEGLAVFTRVAAPGSSNATWTLSSNSAVVAFMGAFSGVDPAKPVEAAQTVSIAATSSVTGPSLTTSSTGGAAVAMYAATR